MTTQSVPKSDGRDLLPLLSGRSGGFGDRPIFWHYPHVRGVAGPGIAPFSAVRKGEWKLIYYHADGRKELYNLADDIREERDRSAERPDQVVALSRLLAHHLREVGTQMPTDKATGKSVPLP